MANINRRQVLSGASALTFATGLGALGAMTRLQAAHAADVSGYKALVCIFLFGGMDHADTVLPYDTASLSALQGLRQGVFSDHGAARDRAALLPLDPDNAADFGGREFALPAELAPLQTLFNSGEAAVVGGVGTLVEPATRTSVDQETIALPGRLFSHNDQQSTWMSMGVEGQASGWGGRFGEAVLRSNPSQNPIFTTITASGSDTFLASPNTRQFRVSSRGLPRTDAIDRSAILGNGASRDEARARLRAFLGGEEIAPLNLYLQDYTAGNRRWFQNKEAFEEAAAGAPALTTSFPNSGIGGQLEAIAQAISLRGRLSASRQVFYASLGGFDNHSGLADNLPGLHAQLADAIAAFRAAMIETGAWNDVTLFTASDFGRTVIGNGDGSDHGWGGHHFVVGGSVSGKSIYGAMTGFDIDGADREQYFRRRGILIPSVSVDQYAATLGRWFGLDAGELSGALPNLTNFPAADLGFMGA